METAPSSRKYCSISAPARGACARHGFDVAKCVGIVWVILIVLATVQYISAESWDGIHPLKSRRSDVERLLGVCPENESTARCLYKLEDKNLLVEYSVGAACSETEAVWNVPSGTVLRITVHQTDGGILLKDLAYDLKIFRREDDSELPGLEHYNQPEKGLALEVRGGFVQSLYFGPSALERKKFACK